MSRRRSEVRGQKSAGAINLHIEKLVLHGFASTDRHRIAEAVQRELTRLFTEGPTPTGLTSSSSTAALNAGSFQLPPSSRPETIGAEVARAVFGRIKQ